MSTRFDGIAEFTAVARLGSFTAAAAELGVTKSAVARAVSRLEAHLGAVLLYRTTRRLTLTPDGRAWLEYCRAALAELEQGESALTTAQNIPSGRIRIDLPTAFGRLFVMPLLFRLTERYPGLILDVSFNDRMVDLLNEGIDLAVRIGAPDDTQDLVVRRLGVQQLLICAAPSYLAARGTPLTGSDLVNHDCIVGWQRERQAAWLLKQPDGSAVPVAISVKHRIRDFEMMRAAVRAGRGIAQLPHWLVGDDLHSGQLTTVLDLMSGAELPINALWPRTRTLPARMRVVIDEIVQNARDFLDRPSIVKPSAR